MWYLLSLLLVSICAAQTTDGGRGELPGMRKDIFDQMKDAKNKGLKHRSLVFVPLLPVLGGWIGNTLHNGSLLLDIICYIYNCRMNATVGRYIIQYTEGSEQCRRKLNACHAEMRPDPS